MTVDQVKAKVNKIFSESCSAQVYLVLKSESGFELRLADIEDAAEEKIRSMFSEAVRSRISQNDELNICNLSDADDRTNALFYYDRKKYPDELSVFKNFTITRADKEAPKFNFRNDDISSLFGYIVYLGSMSDGLLLFKKHYPICLIKRASFWLKICRDNTRFEMMSDELFHLSENFQLIRLDDEIYVTDIGLLENHPGFEALIFRRALSAINVIKNLKLLEDIQVLKDSAEEIAFARKLSRVKKTSPIFTNNIPKEDIVEFIKKSPWLQDAFECSEDGKIRLNTPESKDVFIKLLNDAFLRSELTKEYYETRSKDKLVND